MHILLSNILSIYYSTSASYVNITILQKYSGIGVHTQVINTRLLLSSHVAWVRGYLAHAQSVTHIDITRHYVFGT